MTNKIYLDVTGFLATDFNERTAMALGMMYPALAVSSVNVNTILQEAERSPLFPIMTYQTIATTREALPVLMDDDKLTRLIDLLAWDKNIVVIIPGYLLTTTEQINLVTLIKQHADNYLVVTSASQMNALAGVVVTYGSPHNTTTGINPNVDIITYDEYVSRTKPMSTVDALIDVLNNALVDLKANANINDVLVGIDDYCKRYKQPQPEPTPIVRCQCPRCMPKVNTASNDTAPVESSKLPDAEAPTPEAQLSTMIDKLLAKHNLGVMVKSNALGAEQLGVWGICVYPKPDAPVDTESQNIN